MLDYVLASQRFEDLYTWMYYIGNNFRTVILC